MSLLEHRFENCDGIGRLLLIGELNIGNVAKLKDLMQDLIGRVEVLVLDTGALTMIDVAGLQLVCSAHRMALVSGKTFRLENAGDKLTDAADRIGFFRSIGCLSGLGTDCLWLENAWDNTPTGSLESITPAHLKNRSEGKCLAYHIRFKPRKEILLKGADPSVYLENICSLGESITLANTDGIPLFHELEPELCYVHWDIFLKSDREIESIRNYCPDADHGSLEISLLTGGNL